MLFTDHNRIDLKFIQLDKFKSVPLDSQTIVLLDKNLDFGKLAQPSDKDYFPSAPTEKEFQDSCNEFLWVSTTAAKGICRKQLTYTKFLIENIVKEQLIKLLTWDAAILTHHKKSIGACGKYLEQFLGKKTWNKFCKTYVDANYENIWNGLFLMHELFQSQAMKVANYYKFDFEAIEAEKVFSYLKSIKENE